MALGEFTNKIDFAVLIMVKNANPNGDPLRDFRRMYQTEDQEPPAGYGRSYFCAERRALRRRM